MDLHEKLGRLGLELSAAPKPVAAYVPAVRSGGLLFVSGQLPMRGGELIAAGVVGSAVSVERAAEGARQCVLNALAVVDGQIGGDWSVFNKVVRLGVFVASADGFTEQSVVANGASELLVEVFGEAGRHSRAAVGVNALPLGASVEVELVAELL